MTDNRYFCSVINCEKDQKKQPRQAEKFVTVTHRIRNTLKIKYKITFTIKCSFDCLINWVASHEIISVPTAINPKVVK